MLLGASYAGAGAGREDPPAFAAAATQKSQLVKRAHNNQAFASIHRHSMHWITILLTHARSLFRGEGLGVEGGGGGCQNVVRQAENHHFAGLIADSRHVLAFRHCSGHWITIRLTRALFRGEGLGAGGRRRRRLPTKLFGLVEPGHFTHDDFSSCFAGCRAAACVSARSIQ